MTTDMSAEAVTARLRRVSQLRRLCLSLAKAKPIQRDEPAPRGQPPEHGEASEPSPHGRET